MKKRPQNGILAGLLCAFYGLKLLVKTQRSARIHLGATLIVIVLGLWLHLSRGEWVLLALAAALVWAAEAFNTAIEMLADALHPRQSPQIGAAKDVAAAGVLLTALGALAIGAGVLAHYFFDR